MSSDQRSVAQCSVVFIAYRFLIVVLYHFCQEPIEDCKGDDNFQMETQGKLHVLFSGTKVVNHTPVPKTASGLKGIDIIFLTLLSSLHSTLYTSDLFNF